MNKKNIYALLIALSFMLVSINDVKAKKLCDQYKETNWCVDLNNGKMKVTGTNLPKYFKTSKNEVDVNSYFKSNISIKDYQLRGENLHILDSNGYVYGIGNNKKHMIPDFKGSYSYEFVRLKHIPYKTIEKFAITDHERLSKGEVNWLDMTNNKYCKNRKDCYGFLKLSNNVYQYDNGEPFYYDTPAYHKEFSAETGKLIDYAYSNGTYKSKKNKYYLSKYIVSKKYSKYGNLYYKNEYRKYTKKIGKKKYKSYKTYKTKKYSNKKMNYYKYEYFNTKGKRTKLYIKTVKENKTNYTKKKYILKNNKTKTKLYTYKSNTKGQFKSNKYGKAYRYKTIYKKGKAKKTYRQKYNSKGKLTKKLVRVKLLK